MPRLYLPYNFIPVTAEVNNQATPRWRYDFQRGEDPQQDSGGLEALARHDIWQRDRLHGRILCHLTLRTETVVGNKHGDKKPVVVDPYLVDGKPALPGNSLRGIIASLMETLSQSTLRVLERSPAKSESEADETTDRWRVFQDIDPDLVPWNPDRTQLTPAEAILGVAEDQSGAQGAPAARNLASRLRFFDALQSPNNAESVFVGPAVQLKELGSPKPIEIPKDKRGKSHNGKTPSLYFHNRDGDLPIPKETLSSRIAAEEDRPIPNGRKVYLAHRPCDVDLSQLRGDNAEMNLVVQALARGTRFFFHIDFNNLSAAELTLLKTALVPGDYFHHSLGLGKSFGLGLVKIEIAGLFLREPFERYSLDALASPAYQHSGLIDSALQVWWEKMDRYKLESSAAKLEGGGAWLWQDDKALIDAESLALVTKVGGTSNTSLQENTEIRWRRGHLRRNDGSGEAEEPATALRPIRRGYLLPAFYEPDHETLTPEYSQTDNNSQADEWIRETIEKLAERPYLSLTPKIIDKSLAGRAMLREWEMLNDTELRAQVRDLILNLLQERDALWNMNHSVKKAYESWTR